MKLDVNRDVIMLYDYFRIPYDRHKQIHDRIMELRTSCSNMGEVIEKIVEEFSPNDNELVYTLVEYGIIRGRDGGMQGGWDLDKYILGSIKRLFRRNGDESEGKGK